MRTALVTGAYGFFGRHLIQRLRTAAVVDKVIGTSRISRKSSELSLDELLVMDMTRPSGIAGIIKSAKPDWIFHLAGVTNGTESEIYNTNVLGTMNLLEAARIYSPQSKVLLVGSAAEYGIVSKDSLPVDEDFPCNPVGAYGISKYSMTIAGLDHAKRHGLKVVVVRPFNVLGAGMPVSVVAGAFLEKLKQSATTGESIISMGNLETQRDFLAVDDLVEAFVDIMKGKFWGEIINLCTGIPLVIRDVLEGLASLAEFSVTIRTDPELSRLSDLPVIYGSAEKARRLFDFKPKLTLEEAIANAYQGSSLYTPCC